MEANQEHLLTHQIALSLLDETQIPMNDKPVM